MYYINDALETETRFDTIKFFNFNGDNVDPLTSFMMLNVPLLPEQGNLVITKQEKRPDLLSYSIYKDTQYWWVLLLYNHILSVNELVNGKTISYPSKNSIEYLYERASILKKTT